MNPTILGVIGPGFLNQVPTLLIIGIWRRKKSTDLYISPILVP